MGDPGFVIAAVGFGLSGIASAVRLVTWFLNGDPRAIARTGRWGVIGLLILSFPMLLGLLVNQRWIEALGLSTVMLAVFAFYGPRLLGPLLTRKLRLDTSGPGASTRGWTSNSDPREADRVARSIAVLEEYLKTRTGAAEPDPQLRRPRPAKARDAGSRSPPNGPPMSKDEALEVLGLAAGAGAPAIHEAHRRLMQIVHPDRGGSAYFAVKVNQARDVLLGLTALESGAEPKTSARRRKRENRQAEL